MKYYVVIGLLLHCLLVAARYQPNWDSLNSRTNPEWYDDAKFGIFIHWVRRYLLAALMAQFVLLEKTLQIHN